MISTQTAQAHERISLMCLQEAKRFATVRRDSPTGAQAMHALVKTIDSSYSKNAAGTHVPLMAELIDEPDTGRVVHMLDALSHNERQYYMHEENIVNWGTRSQILFEEIQDHYGFIGGSEIEFQKYFARRDIPRSMWTFMMPRDVKATSGFSCAAKELKTDDPELIARQRKLLMSCGTKYVWSDVRKREDHGILGGAALCSVRSGIDHLAVATLDASNAFSSVETP